MLYIPDLVVISAVNRALERLRNNPDELEFLLSGYMCLKPVAELTGGYAYVKQLMDVILGVNDKKLIVSTYYNTNQTSNYELFVVASGGESTMFLGDQGQVSSCEVSARVYLTANASKVLDKRTLKFLKSTCACDIVFPSMTAYLKDGDCEFSAKVVSVINHEDYVHVTLDKDVPLSGSKPKLNGWQFKSPVDYQVVDTHASGDSVSVQLLLRTAGDAELHKLFAMIVRFALKSERQFMTTNGLQVSRVSQSPLSEEGSTQDIVFTSNFSLNATAFDHWIYSKSTPPDRVSLEVTATSDNPQNEDVKIL